MIVNLLKNLWSTIRGYGSCAMAVITPAGNGSRLSSTVHHIKATETTEPEANVISLMTKRRRRRLRGADRQVSETAAWGLSTSNWTNPLQQETNEKTDEQDRTMLSTLARYKSLTHHFSSEHQWAALSPSSRMLSWQSLNSVRSLIMSWYSGASYSAFTSWRMGNAIQTVGCPRSPSRTSVGMSLKTYAWVKKTICSTQLLQRARSQNNSLAFKGQILW